MKLKLPNLEDIPNYNFKKITLIGFFILVGGLGYSYVLFPTLLKTAMKFNLKLRSGSQMREMFDELPFPLVFKVYLFNITNPDEVSAGGKPRVEEVGPYTFHKHIVRIDQSEDKVADTLEYTLINTFIFQPELSHGLTGRETVILPHPLLTLMALSVKVDREPMLPLIAGAIKVIFNDPPDMFWRGRAWDIMFQGLEIDCTSEDFNAKAVCSVLEAGEIKSVTPMEEKENFFKFSFFGHTNATSSGRWKVMRGVKNIKDLGKVVEIDGEHEFEAWDGDECNEFRGTDGTIFSPFNQPEDVFWSTEPAICRAMKVDPTGKKTKYRGVPTRLYTLNYDDIANTPELQCYCRDEGECPRKGTIDLFPCMGAPLIASNPHFLFADPELLDKIIGLHPNEKDHAVYAHFELNSGTPMSAAKRVMLSYEIVPIEEIEQMKNLQEMALPMLWIDEGANLNKTYVNQIKYQLILALRFRAFVKYASIVIGLLASLGGAYMHVRVQKAANNPIPQVKQFMDSNHKSPMGSDTQIETISHAMVIDGYNKK